MKIFYTGRFITQIIICEIFFSLTLSACIPLTEKPFLMVSDATATMPSSPLSNRTAIDTNVVIKTLAHIPPDCLLLAISPNIVWVVVDCTSGLGLEIGRAGQPQLTPLFAAAFDEHARYAVAFSPNDQKLVVVRSNGTVWLFDVGNWQSPKTLFQNSTQYSVPIWAPDSKSIAITYLHNDQALSILELDGTFKDLLRYSEVHKAVGSVANLFGPSWSPDGTKLAYVITTDLLNPDPIQFWTINAVTGDKELLYSGKTGEVGYSPAWSPAGSMIAVDNFIGQNNVLSVFNLREKKFITLLTRPIDSSGNYVWSPDGTRLAICAGNGTLYVVPVSSSVSTQAHIGCDNILIWKDNDSVISEDNQNLDLISLH